MKRLALLALFVVGCRTEIAPAVKTEPMKRARAAGDECHVIDYPTASEVPAKAKNIGWVKIARQDTDEATFEKLREAVCAQGGDAMSQMHWIRASGASVADAPIELEGNAWVLP